MFLYYSLLFLFFTMSSLTAITEMKTKSNLLLTAPEGWSAADPKILSPSVKMMIVGKGAYELPPSINLGTEIYPGTLKAYLKRVKEINKSKGAGFKDLGTIETKAGTASLSQVDKKTEWGDIRMMHLILKKEDTIYIVTATARKEEFPAFYKSFFDSLKSIRFEEVSTVSTVSPQSI